MSKAENPTREKYATIGILRRSRGNRGELFIEPTSDDLINLQNAREGELVDDNSGLRHQIRVENFWVYQNKAVIKFEGVNTIEAAKRLTGFRLELPVDALRPLEKDEYYVNDLIGLEVKLETGRVLGKVDKVIPTGGKDVLMIKGQKGEILMPFVNRFIKQLDLKKQEIVAVPPEGLLDIYEI